jgi:hypothetical protein
MTYLYIYTLNEPNDEQYPNMSDFPMWHHLHIAVLAVNHVPEPSGKSNPSSE